MGSRTEDLKLLLKIAHNSNNAFLIRGKHGIGKSEIVETYGRENNYHTEILFLSHQETGDLIGIPESKNGVTTWTEPVWLKKMKDAESRGIRTVLFLDEINRAPQDVRQAALQLVLSKEIHQHKLPKDTLVVAAINPEDDGDVSYQVDELDPALNSRFMHFELKPDAKEWVEWAKGNDVHSGVIDYVSKKPEMIWFQTKAKSDVIHPTPRSWTQLSRALVEAETLGLTLDKNPGIFYSLIEGKIGRSCTQEFFAHLKSSNRFEVKHIADIAKKIKETEPKAVWKKINDLTKEVQKGLKTLEPIQIKNMFDEVLASSFEGKNAKDVKAQAAALLYFASIDAEILITCLKNMREKHKNKWDAFIALDEVQEKALIRKATNMVDKKGK